MIHTQPQQTIEKITEKETNASKEIIVNNNLSNNDGNQPNSKSSNQSNVNTILSIMKDISKPNSEKDKSNVDKEKPN